MALCFWGDPPAVAPIFVTSVYRREGQSDFSEQDVASLGRIHPFLDCAVSRLCEREAAQAVHTGMSVAVRDVTRGFAILNQDLRLLKSNAAAGQLCAVWNDEGPASTQGAPGIWRLPLALRAACLELHDEWQSLLRSDPDTTGVRRHRDVAHARVPGLKASLTLVCPDTIGLARPTFVLQFERRVHGVPLNVVDRSNSLLQRMTSSERAVARVLADGLSNQEIADSLGKTVDAVKFLLHRIYQKTGLPGRAALVAVLRSRARRRRSTRFRIRPRRGAG